MKKAILITSIIIVFIIAVNFIFANNVTKTDTVISKIEFKGMNLVALIKKLKNNTLEELKLFDVNYISLIPYAFVNQEKATVSFNSERQWWGEKTEGLKVCIDRTHQKQMFVMLKPHLWISHNIYSGDLDFETENEWKKWENDYENYILSMATIDQDKKIALFCIGTELNKSIEKRPQYWTSLIKKIRAIYSGKLTYAANWDDFEKVPFWNQLDYIGIDAYFPLSTNETPSINELKLAWKQPIDKMDLLYKKIKKPILFTEFGYRNSNECAKEPWKEDNKTQNNQGQVNAYEALFSELSKKSWFKGGFAWKWYADDYYKTQGKIDYTPQGKPALDVIKKWY
tara:strand:+ start:37499 stop:38521 length:1023 start_codon:yes stop_codon:yes gene_type:complete